MVLTKIKKIAKLAKWMGWHKEGRINHPTDFCWRNENDVMYAGASWDPFTNIADAWMLVEKGQNIAEFLSKIEATICYGGAGIFYMTASEAANAISEIALERIDGSKTKE